MEDLFPRDVDAMLLDSQLMLQFRPTSSNRLGNGNEKSKQTSKYLLRSSNLYILRISHLNNGSKHSKVRL